MKHGEVTEKIIRAFYRIYNTLGHGFLEKVYENALALELEASGMRIQQQAPIKVLYRGQVIGEYFADLFVEGRVIVELKAVEALSEAHSAQLINYLRATNIEVGLLLNFGPKPEVQRKIYDIRPGGK